MGHSAIQSKTDLSGYIRLCAETEPSYNQGLAMAAALQRTTVQAMLSHKWSNKGCFKCGGLGCFKNNCPRKKGMSRQSDCAPGICPQYKKGNH